MHAAPASPAVRKRLKYGEADKKNFKKYFSKKKKGKGRPKKRKRGRPKKKKTARKATKQKKLSPVLVDLTKKAKAQLYATLEGGIQAEKRKPNSRINWDLPENAKRREKIVNSWQNKNDLWRAGDSYNMFCKRCDISRGVLSRFIERRANEEKNGKSKVRGRGKPTLLPESVMRHVCEGLCCICFVMNINCYNN